MNLTVVLVSTRFFLIHSYIPFDSLAPYALVLEHWSVLIDLNILPLRKEPGEVYSLEELEDAILRHKADLLFVTHGESTGGTLQDVSKLGPICHKHNCLLAVDAVVSIAVDPLFVDRWEIDAVTAGSQKAVGAPPGMCLMSFSERAM